MRIRDWSSDVCSSDLADGGFDAAKFAERSADPQVKMIDVKLSQGAKPGHGGVLPAAKVSPEIVRSDERRVGKECVCTCRSRWYPYHSQKHQHHKSHYNAVCLL